MRKQILFIQGAGEGAYQEDRTLVSYLQDALGDEYELLYPKIAGLESTEYAPVKAQLGREFLALNDQAILVAHSLGGAALLKHLSEEKPVKAFAGIFLAATPYKGEDGEWGTDDFALQDGFSSSLLELPRFFMYHSHDDEWVPFAHLTRYGEKLSQATIREVAAGGHQFSRGLPELIEDIKRSNEGKSALE